jgi:hypothetical protein
VQILNEDDLRDCFAMFAMNGILKSYSMGEVFDEQPERDFLGLIAKDSYVMADAMLEARKPKEEAGIASVKRTRKTK